MNGPGDDAAAGREQEDDEVGDLVDLPELAHGQAGRGLLEPVVAGAVEAPLGRVLALGLGPADVHAVDPDPVPPVRERGIAGQPDQAGLRGDVRRQVGLATVGRHRDDVDDGAARAAGDHVLDRCLHEEERTAKIDRDVLVEEFRAWCRASCPRVVRPAQFTRPSTRPNRATVSATAAWPWPTSPASART